MKKLYLLTLLALFPLAFAFAQIRLIKGTVRDQSGSPIPGASILIKGAIIATTTDNNGNFELQMPPDSQKVMLSIFHMGMKPLFIGSDEDLSHLVMEEDIKQLPEMIAIGYGMQERINNTGSISTIKEKDFQNVPVTSFEQAIQGRAPGVQISGASGELASVMKVLIRGPSSITASNQPLVVIDGFIVTTQDQTNFPDNNASNPLADLNPNDIAYIEVLKDAAASAIYGARGSNGVLLITTKRGASGKTKFIANYSTGISEPTHLQKFLDRDQYIQMFTDAAKNSEYNTDPNGLDSAWTYAGGMGSFTDLVNSGTNENWNKAAYRTGRYSQYGLSVSGGNDKTKFLTSFSYLDQQGIIIQNDLKRLTGRLNLDHEATKWLRLGFSFNQNYTVKMNTPSSYYYNSPLGANVQAPIYSIRDQTGAYNNSVQYANPFQAVYNSKDKSTEFRNFSNGYVAINLFPTLTFRSELGIDLLNLYEYGWQGANFPSYIGPPSSGKYGTSKVLNYTTNNTLTYLKTLRDLHYVQVTLGQTFQHSNTENSAIKATGLPSDNFQYLINASENTAYASTATSFAYLSYFGRINYNFRHTYLFSFSIREDGSSRFSTNHQYAWFPAISAGYIVSETHFYKSSVIASYLNFLKLKSSYGLTGNSEIGNFASKGLYSTSKYGDTTGFSPSQLANPNLQWEKTIQWNIGVEFGLFQNRISGGIDYYIKNTKNLLQLVPIPATSGYLDPAGNSTTLVNSGTMQNKGWDLYISSQNIVRKFKWSTTLNFSTYKNRVTNLNELPILPSGQSLNAAIEGQPLGVFYGVAYAGVDPQNGNALYYLSDGSTTSDWSKANQSANYRVLGNPNPKNFGGIINTFEYAGFDLSIFGQWTYGNNVYNAAGEYQNSGFAWGTDNQTVDQMNYWKQPGDQTNVPKPELYPGNGAHPSSRYISDASYFRFKTITLGYTIAQSLVSKAKFSSIRLYVTAQNWFTITRYKGNDPEGNFTPPGSTVQTSNLQNGVDYYSAPQAKTIVIGITAAF
jgi:TonB-linked SusC/RagA family outer membrane protein